MRNDQTLQNNKTIPSTIITELLVWYHLPIRVIGSAE